MVNQTLKALILVRPYLRKEGIGMTFVLGFVALEVERQVCAGRAEDLTDDG